MSQLDLALEASVSARHLSFMESGRARPSAAMVLRLAEALGVPLRERNAMLISAGHAPVFGDGGWESLELAELRAAARLIITSHLPNPAIVLDGAFTVLDANSSAWNLLGERLETPPNLVDLVFQPGKVRDAIENWDEVARYFIHRMREAARIRGQHSPIGQKLREALAAPRVADLPLASQTLSPARVLLPLVFTREGMTTRWFTTITSFGGPQDALAEEITIEQFHPA